ncbi:MAG TPA: acetylornithine deacetylase [Gemmatimonadota bacterium]|nr:acetylornithine deacetylase [Gemmatimonadota bacterium]
MSSAASVAGFTGSRASSAAPPSDRGGLRLPGLRLDDVELLSRLVAFDTTSSESNLPFVDFVSEILDRPGVRLERHASPDGRKANLLAAIGPDPDDHREGLLLSGHSDVVPAMEPGWTGDPFLLRRDDERLIGRGACDMKGFVALAVNRLATARVDRLRHPLALLLTYDEEVGTLGARRYAEKGGSPALPRRTIVGEPTDLRPIRLHKGHLRLRVVTTGTPAHSAFPALGRNAVEPAARAIISLAELDRTLREETPASADRFPEAPYSSLNVGTVTGGTAANIVPDRCEVLIGIRLLPGIDPDEMTARVADAVREVIGDADWTLEPAGLSPALEAPAQSDLLAALRAASGRSDDSGVGFATDAGWLDQVGHECVLFGPGSIEVAHRPDEFLPVPQLVRAGAILDGQIARWCGDG